MHGRVDHRIGDHPEPVAVPFGTREGHRRSPAGDPIQHRPDACLRSLVQKPQRLEADLGCPQQRQAIFLGTAVRALVRQHHLVRVRLEPQRGDQVAADAAVELDLVHVHRP